MKEQKSKRALGANYSQLFCYEQPEQIAQFTLCERFALGHKKGEKLSKTYEKYEFFEQIGRFCERFARIASESLTSLFFKEQIAHGRSLK